MSELPSRESFEAALNSSFELLREGKPPSVLTMYQLETKLATPLQESFAILFVAPIDAPTEQGSYPLQHATLGTHEIFLVPIRQDASGLHYEAVFNRPLR